MLPRRYYDQDFMAQRWSYWRGSTVVLNATHAQYFQQGQPETQKQFFLIFISTTHNI